MAMAIGRDLDVNPDRPTVFLNGAHHGNEVLSVEFVLDHIAQLLEGAGQDERVDRWLDNFIVWAVPVVNPDALQDHDGVIANPNCVAAILTVAIVTVPLRIFDEQGLSRYRELKSELAEVDALNERLSREVDHLTRDVRLLRTDPAAIERIARDELGMIREGELVFQFDE